MEIDGKIKDEKLQNRKKEQKRFMIKEKANKSNQRSWKTFG